MSRTPEVIRDKKAESKQSFIYALSIITGLTAWGAFSGGNAGLGLIMVIITIALFSHAGKIKTRYHKYAEKSLYK